MALNKWSQQSHGLYEDRKSMFFIGNQILGSWDLQGILVERSGSLGRDHTWQVPHHCENLSTIDSLAEKGARKYFYKFWGKC